MKFFFLTDFFFFQSLCNLVGFEAKSIESADEWVYVPTENGGRTKVNLAEARAQIQPFFLASDEVTFELYTLKNPSKPQWLSMSNVSSITESNLNPKVPTRFSIHGWQERGTMRNTFLDGEFDNLMKFKI